jgi:hypothetical protein
MWKRLFRRIEIFSYGGEVISKHTINKDVSLRKLTNPEGVHLSIDKEDTSSVRLSHDEARYLAGVLIQLSRTANDGVKQ